jgi:uncharacterized protein involved in exopolysaccharide biosynthesis
MTPNLAALPVIDRARVRSLHHSDSPQPKLDPTETAISALTDRLTINRVGWSRVIEIGARSRSAEKSAQIANAVATAYIDDQQEAKLQANRTASTWLQERLRQLQGQAAAAERAKVVFKQENNIVSVDEAYGRAEIDLP